MEGLKSHIRDIPDFPKPGIIFKDITPLLGDQKAFGQVIDAMAERYADQGINKVVGIEARGFIFAAPLAYKLGAGLIMVRKPGKLPYKTMEVSYDLEYGSDQVQMHTDAVSPGDRIVIADDVLATGGTISAVADLVRKSQGTIHELCVLIELSFLEGRQKLQDDFFSLIRY